MLSKLIKALFSRKGAAGSTYNSDINYSDIDYRSTIVHTYVDNDSHLSSVVEAQPTFLYSKESLEALRRVFPVARYEPNAPLSTEATIYSAGEQNIIRYIEGRLGKETRRRIN